MCELSVAVVVCAYTMDRWDDLAASLRSAAAQSPAPDELLLVVDHNEQLAERALGELAPAITSLRVIANTRKKGLSGARNTALLHVSSDVVAFLDDDARADGDWLATLTVPYENRSVMAVGGSAVPRWPSGRDRPVTLPSAAGPARGELDWVVGCTYHGLPERPAPVRNLMGSNMSFRRSVFVTVGGFSENLGRVGKTPLGCEETELCIRARKAFPASQIVFVPGAVVHHRVSADRLTWSYLRHRCFAEGLSKAAVTLMQGADQALDTERRYATRVLPAGVFRELASVLRPTTGRRSHHLQSAGAIVLGLAWTTLGYLRGSVSLRTSTGRAAVSSDLGQQLQVLAP
jgi:GT2 family glycosyltransferase